MNPQIPALVRYSVIIPVGARRADAAELLDDYSSGLAKLPGLFELIFVLDGPCEDFAAGLDALARNGVQFRRVQLSKQFGEATALMAGFEHARGEVIITLPAYFQIVGAEIPRLVAGLEQSDVAVARRWPRKGGMLEKFRRAFFHGLLRRVTSLRLNDLGCGARAMSRRVLEEVSLYGDQHRLLPVLADRHGFRTTEVDLTQSPRDRFEGSYRPREYAHRFLDIFSVFFLVRFTKKPLRFFGMVGATTFAVGALAMTWLVVERLFFGVALADRPALLLAALMVVLGLQLFAIGLLGELIIFTHADQLKDYKVDRVIEFPAAEQNAPTLNLEDRRETLV